jgi:hypothetical protein
MKGKFNYLILIERIHMITGELVGVLDDTLFFSRHKKFVAANGTNS